MTKTTHITTGIAAGMAMSLGMAETAALAAGCIFPDMLERFTPLRLKRRGISHWGLAYIILAVMMYIGRGTAGAALPGYAALAGNFSALTPLVSAYFLAGCALHWLADAFTPMGVPVLPGLRLQGPITTGGRVEHALLVLMLLVIFLIWQSTLELSMKSIDTLFMTGTT